MKKATQEHRQLGDQLRQATRRGDLSTAYRILAAGDAEDAQYILLRAGHSVVSPRQRMFWLHAQREVAQACRQLRDGYEMHQANRGAAILIR